MHPLTSTGSCAVALALLAFATIAAPAHAQLNGQTIRASFTDYDDPNTQNIKGQSDVVVGGSVEITTGFGNGVQIDLQDSAILFTFSTSTFFGSAKAFNGYTFFDLFDAVPAFTGASLDSSSTLSPGVTFDDQTILVNFAGVNFTSSDTVLVNFTVPEPASALLLVGAGLMLSRNRRRAAH